MSNPEEDPEPEYDEEARDDADSDAEYDDYASEPEKDPEELDNNYTDLLKEKSRLLVMFNEGYIETNTYIIENAMLTRRLYELQYNARNVEKGIIAKETELRILLEKIENELDTDSLTAEDKLPIRASKTRNVITREQMDLISRINLELEALVDSHAFVEESNEPVESNKLYISWELLTLEERKQLEKIAREPFPTLELYPENLRQREEEFLERIKFYMDIYWNPFLEEEERELKQIAKRYKIKGVPPADPPKNLNEPPSKEYLEYKAFLDHLRSLLSEGYIYKTGIRKAGGVYEKVKSKPTALEMSGFLKKMRAELPYRLDQNEQEYSDKLKSEKAFIKQLKPFLDKLDIEHLRGCAVNKNKYSYVPLTTKQYVQPKPVRVKRELSINSLLKSLNGNGAGLVQKLENYIYKITSGSPNWYKKKINDVLFIFEHYPGFKTKFLGGEINIFQLALFEDILLQNGSLHVYPVNYGVRRDTIRKIIQELYFLTGNFKNFKRSRILTKVILTRRSKELELVVFDLAKNKIDYFSKVARVLKFIKENSPDVALLRPVNNIIGVFNETQPEAPRPVDYKTLKPEELMALLNSTSEKIKRLQKEYNELQAKNYEGTFVIFWKPPPIVNSSDPLLKRFNETLEAAKNIISASSPTGPTGKGPSLHSLILDLNAMRISLIKKYKINYKEGMDLLNRKLREEKEIYSQIEKVYTKYLLETYTPSKDFVAATPAVITRYPVINIETITGLVNVVKRTILKRKYPEVDIGLLELYDLNELMNKKESIHGSSRQPFITKEVYTKIKDYLLQELRKYRLEISIQNNVALEQAIKTVMGLKGISFEIGSYPGALKTLTEQWGSDFAGETFNDYYNENVFQKLLGIVDGVDYFRRNEREYYFLEKRFGPKQQEISRRPTYNFQGVLYNVEYLNKDWSTGQPLFDMESVAEQNPKTGRIEIVEKRIALHGRTPFIKRVLAKGREIWQEVEPGAIRYQTKFGYKKNKSKS